MAKEWPYCHYHERLGMICCCSFAGVVTEIQAWCGRNDEEFAIRMDGDGHPPEAFCFLGGELNEAYRLTSTDGAGGKIYKPRGPRPCRQNHMVREQWRAFLDLHAKNACSIENKKFNATANASNEGDARS